MTRTCAAVSILAVLILAGAVSPCFGDDLLCLDSLWGALFRYDPQTGDREILSGFGMGSELIGDGPMWSIEPSSVSDIQRLTWGLDGTIYLTQKMDVSEGVTVFAIDPRTGDRQAFVTPRQESHAQVLPDPWDPNKIIVFATKNAYRSQQRTIYELTRSTGHMQEIPSDLNIPPADYGSRFPWVLTATDSYGYAIVFTFREVDGDLEGGPFLYNDVRYPPVRKMSPNIVSNVNDIHFDPVRNRLFVAGDWDMSSAPMIVPSFYGPFELMPDPSDSFHGAGGICSWNGMLAGMNSNRLFQIDPDIGQITPLPDGGPVGFGIAAPDHGVMLDDGRLLTCKPGKIVWHDMSTGTTQETPVSIEFTPVAFHQDQDSIYLLDPANNGMVRRYDIHSGALETLCGQSWSTEIETAAVIDDTHIAYVGRSDWPKGCFVYDITSGEETHIFAQDRCRVVHRAGPDSVFVSWKTGSACYITRVWLDGRTELACTYVPEEVGTDVIMDFIVPPDEETIYFTSGYTFALWRVEMGSDDPFIVSGTVGPEIESNEDWIGKGVSWGGPRYAGVLSLYGIQDGFAYLGDEHHDGIFQVDLLTGDRVLLSAPEYFPWLQLSGIAPYIPEPASLSVLAVGAFALITRRRRT